MIIDNKAFEKNGLTYVIRSAIAADAKALSALRPQIDGETQNMDRQRGEGFIDAPGFERLIRMDTASPVN